MDPDRFWLTEAQFSKIAPHLPTDTRGKPRVEDRRVISGIIQVLKSGGRWVDAPPEYGPKKTLYNRYVRWSAKGVWVALFHALAQAGGPPEEVLIDSSAVKAHRSAAGGKGGEKPSHRPLAWRPHDENPRADRRAMPAHRIHDHGRSGRRLQGRRSVAGAASRLRHPARGQGLRLQRHSTPGRRARNGAKHSAQGQPQMEKLLLARPLPQPKRHREDVLPPQGFQASGDPL